MIILEGADGTGKTYAANWLSFQLQIPLHHFGGPPKSKADIINRIGKMFLNPNRIFDRCSIISEPVYGPIIRGDCFFTKQEISNYLYIINKQAKIIYCRPSIQTIFSNKLITKLHKSQEQVDSVKKSLERIIYTYDNFMSRLNTFHFNRDTMELKELLKFCKLPNNYMEE